MGQRVNVGGIVIGAVETCKIIQKTGEFAKVVQTMMLQYISYLHIVTFPCRGCIFERRVVGWGWWFVWVVLWALPRNIVMFEKFLVSQNIKANECDKNNISPPYRRFSPPSMY